MKISWINFNICVLLKIHAQLILFVCFGWCYTSMVNSWGHVGTVSYSQCSWASLPEAGYQYLAHIFSPLTDKCSFLNQQKRKNGRRNIFMTKSSRKDVPGASIYRNASWFPSDIATDRAIAPGYAQFSWAWNFLKTSGLFDFMHYVHSNQLRSCWDGQLLNQTIPGQASWRQFTSIKCPFFRQ